MTRTRDPEKASPTDPRPTYIRLGTDEAGADHVYRTRDELVLVVEQQVTHRFDVADAVLEDYIAHVATHRGWRERRYGRDVFLDRLARAAMEAV